jgi:hypothetical protein
MISRMIVCEVFSGVFEFAGTVPSGLGVITDFKKHR